TSEPTMDADRSVSHCQSWARASPTRDNIRARLRFFGKSLASSKSQAIKMHAPRSTCSPAHLPTPKRATPKAASEPAASKDAERVATLIEAFEKLCQKQSPLRSL